MPNEDVQAQVRSGTSNARKLGIGFAVVAVPVAAAFTVWELKQAEDSHNHDLERGFRYDDAKIREVDPALLGGWTEVGQIQTHVEKPSCIAVAPGGHILVGSERAVKVLDARGMEVASFGIASPASAIAADTKGNIYVAMKSHIEVYSLDGTKQASWTSLGAGSHISSIAIGADGVYIADSGMKVGHVVVMGFDGARKGELAAAGSTPGALGLITPSAHMDVAVTAEGNIWIANPGRHQLELYSRAGELLSTFGQSGTNIDQFLGCCNPSDFALLSDGRIVTGEKGVPRIKLYQSDGHLVNVVAPPTAFGGNRAGLDVAADSQGRVLVLEPGTDAIRLFAEKKS